jgi:hypothetical protein
MGFERAAMTGFFSSESPAGLRAALREILAEAAYQRCYVHFLRNALDTYRARVDDDCMQELRCLYDRRDLPEARPAGREAIRIHGSRPSLMARAVGNPISKPTCRRYPPCAEDGISHRASGRATASRISAVKGNTRAAPAGASSLC